MNSADKNTITDAANDIIQKTAEVEGLLKALDLTDETLPGMIPDHVLWSIRLASRVIDDTRKDALHIIESIEER